MPLTRGAGRTARRRGVGRRGGKRHRQHRDAGRRELPPLGDLSHRPRSRARSRAASGESDVDFHEILFPLDIALKSAGGPERKTEIVALGSGREERNARWAHSRRRYDAGYGVKTLDALSAVVAFFEERRGRLHGFRWRDRLDHSSAAPGASVTPLDQAIGIGDGDATAFPARQDLWRRPRALSAADRKAGRGLGARRGRRRGADAKARRSASMPRPAS